MENRPETVAENFHEYPFAMINWHRNWCGLQKQPGFCICRDWGKDQKIPWETCPNRLMCFVAFIHSDAAPDKGAIDE